MHMKGAGDMSKGYIYLALIAIVLSGCQTKGMKAPPDGLPPVVGGILINNLVIEKEGAPVLEVKFDEIVLSNGQVTVTGEFSGFPGRRLTLHPHYFSGTLACAILFSPEMGKPFRLVADKEFVVETCLPMDQVFKSSTLFAGGCQTVSFSHSYQGFPSDSEVREYKAKMNIISKFEGMYDVSYFMRNVVFARFADQNYEYPNDEWSWVNIKGEGHCIMRVYKDK